MIPISRNIIRFRKFSGMTPMQTAEKIGLPVQEYIAYETGDDVPNLDMITRLASIFKCRADDLVISEEQTLLNMINTYVRHFACHYDSDYVCVYLTLWEDLTNFQTFKMFFHLVEDIAPSINHFPKLPSAQNITLDFLSQQLLAYRRSTNVSQIFTDGDSLSMNDILILFLKQVLCFFESLASEDCNDEADLTRYMSEQLTYFMHDDVISYFTGNIVIPFLDILAEMLEEIINNDTEMECALMEFVN